MTSIDHKCLNLAMSITTMLDCAVSLLLTMHVGEIYLWCKPCLVAESCSKLIPLFNPKILHESVLQPHGYTLKRKYYHLNHWLHLKSTSSAINGGNFIKMTIFPFQCTVYCTSNWNCFSVTTIPTSVCTHAVRNSQLLHYSWDWDHYGSIIGNITF